MAFHEVRFPERISRNATSGPSTLTNIIRIDSAGEERVSRWNNARWRGDAKQGIRKLSDLMEVAAFYRVRRGPAIGFRYKDWMDYASNSTHELWTPAGQADPITPTDVQIGVGDGSQTQLQLKKFYSSGGFSVERPITKPVAGTVRVAINGVEQAEGVDFTVNTTSGIVTFAVAPADGATITAGFEFDVPARFGAEIDEDGLMASVEGFDMGSIPSIPIIELFDGILVPDAVPLLGAQDFDGSANFTVTMLNGTVITVNPTAAGVKMLVPDTLDNLSPGGPYWHVYNRHGSNSLEIRVGTAAGTLVATVGAGTAKIVVLGFDSGGSKKWYGL